MQQNQNNFAGKNNYKCNPLRIEYSSVLKVSLLNTHTKYQGKIEV